MRKLKIILLLCYCSAITFVFAGKQEIGSPDNSKLCEVSNGNIVYHFTKLIKTSDDIKVDHTHPVETFWLQLCTPLKRKCNGKDGYGICLTMGKEEIGVGKFPPKVVTEPGKTLFHFDGDKCKSEVNYTVIIIMKCDYLATDSTSPEVFPHMEGQCKLHMIWRTALACVLPEVQKNCTVAHNGLHYDLSPLTKYSENYLIYTGDAQAPKIILNVCHSLIYEYGALCPKNSGACLWNSTKNVKEEYTNLGNVRNSPFMEDEQLKIHYDEGAICKMPRTAELHIKTTITFICNLKAVDTFPEYVRGSEECHYQLVWITAAACSVESLRNQSEATAGKCSITNPITNFPYNLETLASKDFSTTAKSGNKYTFAVCSPVSAGECKSRSGACYLENGTSMGQPNANLMWQEGGPYLNYTGGDSCGNGQRRYTIIGFMCGAEGSPNTPLVMEENRCQLIINWNTDLVCEKRIKCATNNDEIDLSSLISSNQNYAVKHNNAEFQINVCRPLVPVPGFTCSHGSAACQAEISLTHEYVNETNLGFPLESPTVNDEGVVVLRYAGGSTCKEDSRKMVSTNITFPCSYGGKGAPIFKRYEDCTYFFEWETRIACKTMVGNWFAPCNIRDHQGHEYDLSMLHKNVPEYRVKSIKGKEFNINICGGQKYCNGSAVCLDGIRYGSLPNVLFYYNRATVKLEYSNGDKCMNGFYTSEIELICNEMAGVGSPNVIWERPCIAKFEWQTNVTCGIGQDPAAAAAVPAQPPPGTPQLVQHFSSSHAGAIVGVMLAVLALVGTVFYFRDPNKGARFRSCFNSLTAKRNEGRVQYCRVNTTEEAWLLLDADPTQCQTDSDDDLLDA